MWAFKWGHSSSSSDRSIFKWWYMARFVIKTGQQNTLVTLRLDFEIAIDLDTILCLIVNTTKRADLCDHLKRRGIFTLASCSFYIMLSLI